MKNKHEITGFLEEGRYKLGYRMSGYYIEISEEEYAHWFGKKIKIIGDLLIIPGIDLNNKIISQGASSDSLILTNVTIFEC